MQQKTFIVISCKASGIWVVYSFNFFRNKSQESRTRSQSNLWCRNLGLHYFDLQLYMNLKAMQRLCCLWSKTTQFAITLIGWTWFLLTVITMSGGRWIPEDSVCALQAIWGSCHPPESLSQRERSFLIREPLPLSPLSVSSSSKSLDSCILEIRAQWWTQGMLTKWKVGTFSLSATLMFAKLQHPPTHSWNLIPGESSSSRISLTERKEFPN